MRASRLAFASLLIATSAASLAGDFPRFEDSVKVGRDLFLREWVPNDPRARGGDGLGPVYNANSCVACHFAGGVGGSGPNDKNAEIASASVTLEKKEELESIPRDALVAAHPGFLNSASVVLHKSGVNSLYNKWRKDLLEDDHGRFRIATTERNTPALFGAGLIDSIPDAVIQRRARRIDPDFPEVQGRVSRDAKGRVGKFGWKGQTASLGEFVRTACAVELGLEVPGHPQSPAIENHAAKAPGLDLSDGECDSLVDFVKSLPAPGVRPPFDSRAAVSVDSGRKLFDSVGCATCHAPKLGDVEGIYSDLLLHDMGSGLRDSAIYYGSAAPAPAGGTLASVTRAEPAEADEWRTPPLWGLRDSGPYLHDGRAETVDAAIRAHEGSATAATARYRDLDPESRRQLVAFLGSLVAPRPAKAETPDRGGRGGRSASPLASVRRGSFGAR